VEIEGAEWVGSSEEEGDGGSSGNSSGGDYMPFDPSAQSPDGGAACRRTSSGASGAPSCECCSEEGARETNGSASFEDVDDDGADDWVFESRIHYVTQFQHSQWPDHGVPKSTKGLMDLMDFVHEEQADLVDKNGLGLESEDSESEFEGDDAQASPRRSAKHEPPVVVHCSAGIGRTGTYCVTDIALRNFFEFFDASPAKKIILTQNGIRKLEPADITKILSSVRKDRLGMIQTWQQFRFCFYALHDGVKRLIEHANKRHVRYLIPVSEIGQDEPDDNPA